MKQSNSEWWNIADVRDILGGEQRYVAHGRLDGTDFMDDWECFYNEESRKFYCCSYDSTIINKEVFDVEWLTLYPEFSWSGSTKTAPSKVLSSLMKIALIMDQQLDDTDAHEEGSEHLRVVLDFVKPLLRDK